jgi:CHAD domain-containing protein
MPKGPLKGGHGPRRTPAPEIRAAASAFPGQGTAASPGVILVRQAGWLFSYEGRILRDPDPDTVHDMRVAARRLRALLRIFRKAFDRDGLRAQVAMLSGLIRSLGRVRDCDIIVNNLETLRHVLAEDSQAALDDLVGRQRALRDAHSAALRQEVRALRDGKARKEFLAFVESPMVDTPVLRRGLKENAERLLPVLLKEMTSYRREVVAHPERTALLHEMRIAARPLRYFMEAIEPAFGKPFSKRLKELKDFLDIAGEVHDCDMMIALLTGQFGKSAPGKRRHTPEAEVMRAARLAKLLATQRGVRRKKFGEFRKSFGALGGGKFRKKLLRSVQ